MAGRVEIDGWGGSKIEVWKKREKIEPELKGEAQTPDDNFIDAILGRAEAQTSPINGVIQSELMDAIYESAEKRSHRTSGRALSDCRTNEKSRCKYLQRDFCITISINNAVASPKFLFARRLSTNAFKRLHPIFRAAAPLHIRTNQRGQFAAAVRRRGNIVRAQIQCDVTRNFALQRAKCRVRSIAYIEKRAILPERRPFKFGVFSPRRANKIVSFRVKKRPASADKRWQCRCFASNVGTSVRPNVWKSHRASLHNTDAHRLSADNRARVRHEKCPTLPCC